MTPRPCSTRILIALAVLASVIVFAALRAGRGLCRAVGAIRDLFVNLQARGRQSSRPSLPLIVATAG